MIEETPYPEILKTRRYVMYPDKDIDDMKLPEDEQGLHPGYYEW
ncbi:hypothetical protein [Viscerimonas tarda]